MTPAQMKYLRERLSGITSQKVSALKDKYPSKFLSDEEVQTALLDGNYSIKELKPIGIWGRSGDIRQFISFNDDVDNGKIYREKEKEIRAESTRILDAIMLDDEVGLADALKTFADKEF